MVEVRSDMHNMTSLAGNILDMLVVMIFPFFGISEMGDNRPAC